MFEFDELPCAVLVTDARGRIERVNRAGQTLLGGGAPDAWLGRSIDDALPVASRIFLQTHVWPMLRKQGLVEEVFLQWLDGQGAQVPVLLNARTTAEGGSPQVVWTLFVARQRSRFEAALLDMRKRAEMDAQRIEASERFTRSVTDAVPSLLARWDQDLRCQFANHAYFEWFGRLPDEVVGLHMRELLGEALFALDEPFVNAALAGERQQFERQLIKPDGSTGYVLATYVPVLVDGVAQGFIAQVSDFTALKLTEQALHRSQQFLQRTGRLAGVGGWEMEMEMNMQRQVVRWSDEVCRIIGVPEGYRPTLDEALAFYAPSSRLAIESAVQQAQEFGEGFDLELTIVRADGVHRQVRVLGSVERAEGQPARIHGAMQDVTERVALAAELAQQHELLRVTLQSIGDAVITTDAVGVITWLNPAAVRMTGWPLDEACGRDLAQVFHIVHAQTRKPAESPVQVCLAQQRVVGLASNTLLMARDGTEFGIEDSAAPILSGAGELLGAVLVFHDVTEQRRLSGEMTFRATHDALTGLVNRMEFETRLQHCLENARIDRSSHALMFIDLDQFKLVNDACGHAAGDLLLKQVSRLLGEAVRGRDTLARLGGDEFAVLLAHCTVEQAERVAQQICARMDDYRFVHDDRRFRIGASIGLVPVDQRWASTAAAVQAADAACYAAKEGGRNRVHIWYDTDQAMHARQGETQWAARLELALDEEQFLLFAQRISRVDGAAQGLYAEVLLRLREADGSLVLPGAFMPAAERFHFAVRIDRWVLRAVLTWLQALPPDFLLDTLCVNLSGQSVGDRAFHRHAVELLGALAPALRNKICLEITETVAISHLADAALFIEQVRALGVRVALDDFGAGASSFGYLKHLGVDLIKIDGQFVKDLIGDRLNEAAVRCFVEVARAVGVPTVAEFVDRPAVLARVRELGVDYAQGFLLHQPEPLAALLADWEIQPA